MADRDRSGVAHPRLSVLIFTYNRQRMLADCLDSVVPTTADCEIAVFDDGSTDGTAELVRGYAERDARMRYFQQPTNVGLLANIEKAAKEARGEYITLLADDDSVEPGNYERKVAILEAYPRVGFIYSLAYATDENLQNRSVLRRMEYVDQSYIGGRAEFADLISGNYIYGPGVVFRRSLMDEHGVMDGNLPPAAYPLSDWDLWLRYMSHTETAFINEPLVNVRFHGSSVSLHSSDMAMGMIAVWRKWLVDREDPPVLEKRTWERMQTVFRSEVQRLHGHDPAKTQACITAFDELYRAAAANASLAFARRTRRIVTAPAEQSKGATVVWTGPAGAIGGIASDLRGMVTAAEAVPGISLRLEELNWGLPTAEPRPSEGGQRLTESVWRPLLAGNTHTRVWQGPLAYWRPDDQAGATAARLAFTGDTPPPDLLEKAGDLQVLWLPTHFQSDVLRQSGIASDKLKVLPTCVDIGNGGAQQPIDPGTGRHFNFISMAQLADSGLEVLVRAFAREFQPDEDVALVLILRTPPTKTMEQLAEELRTLIQRELGTEPRQFPPINLRTGPLADNMLAGLLAASQAYVEPRPSAWGRGVLEAMARGVTAIGVQSGPNLDMLSEDNSFTTSAEATPASLGRLMRQAFSSPKETRRRGERARAEVAAKHGPAVVGRRLAELLEELA